MIDGLLIQYVSFLCFLLASEPTKQRDKRHYILQDYGVIRG